jgi:hypothetical protein
MDKNTSDSFNEIFARMLDEALAKETDRMVLGPPIAEIDGKPVTGIVNFTMRHESSGGFLWADGSPIDMHELEAEMWRTVGIDIEGGEDEA